MRRDDRPAFATALLDPSVVCRRVVDNFLPLRTRRGGAAAQVPAPPSRGQNTEYPGWVGRGGDYTIAEYALGMTYTRTMNLNDKYGELRDAAFEVGQNATRTRTLVIIGALYASAPSLVLPNGANGPDVANMQAVLAAMPDQEIDGREYSTAPTDLCGGNVWRT